MNENFVLSVLKDLWQPIKAIPTIFTLLAVSAIIALASPLGLIALLMLVAA